MKNKFRRSLTSVLLAASLLFSSQSVVAFADYGSKSDASDLSPVQESVENATEEQQEDPSLSVEPVIGESTEAPVAAPMMARANAPVAYSAPSVDENRYESSQLDDASMVKDAIIRIYQTKNISKYGKPVALNDNSGDTFTQGIGYRIYTANTNIDGWVFKNWTTHIYRDADIFGKGGIDSDNLDGDMDFAPGSHAFSIENDTTQAYTSGKTVRINHLLTHGESSIYPLYYTLSANFNPLVTVDVGENGKVTYNGTVVDKDTTDKKVEVEYGTAPDFTITPDTGYKVASVTFGDTTIQANEDGTYTLPSVTEPTTLKVEFEETEENIDVEDLGLGVKFECTDNDSHNSENIMLKVADKNTYYTISPVDGTTATVTIDANKYLENYNTTNPNHRLVSPSEEYKIQLTLVNNTWTVDEGSTTIVTIPVTCKAEVKQIEHIEINLGENLKKELKVDPLYLHAEYDGKYIFLTGRNGYFTTPTGIEDLPSWVIDFFKGGPIPESLTTDVNDATKAKKFFNGFTFIEWNLVRKQNISFEYIYDVKVDGTTLYITLETPTTEVPELKPDDLAKGFIKFECMNDSKHNSSSTYLNNFVNGTFKVEYTGNTATVKPADPVSLVSNWKSGHMYVKSDTPEQITFTYSKDTGWTVDESKNTITVKMICAPTIDEINAKLDVSVDCNNANANPEHKAMIFEDLLADSYEIGTPELSGSEYICDVTVKAEKYVTEYDKEYRPEHSNADNQTVTFKFKDGKWTLESDPISVNFIVTCDFPNGPSEDEIAELGLKLQLNCATTPNSHGIVKYDVTNKNTFEVSDVIYTDAADAPSHYYVNVTVDGSSYLTQYNNDKGVHSWVGSNEAVFKVYARELEIARKTEYIWNIVDSETMTLQVQHTNPTDPTDPGTNPGGNGGDNDDDDDRYTGGNTVTRTINDDDVPLNDRPNNTTTIDDDDVPLADLPDDTVTIDDGEVPLKANPSTGDSLPFAAMAAAALSLGGVIVLNRKKK